MPARYGFVVEAHTDAGPLIMRASPDPNGAFQAGVAMRLAELGVAPRIHEVFQGEAGTWTVMERVTPGTTLAELPLSVESLPALGALLRPLVGQPAPLPGMPTLCGWLRRRLDEGDHLSDLAPGRTPAPQAQRTEALSILAELEGESADGLCHGDASTRNILAGPSGLLVIDPRGVSGDIAYDVAVIALKARTHVPLPNGESVLADSVGVARDRTAAWFMVADAARV
ncbi:aminoglycoside phosphotransferase family protein [Nonomuraea dietziae]|uniref:aminoglycoside phosphotransferase family protein n=1 Tax=Nonomuraea dietziae TaxID=65515 RepID=UPI00344310A5